MTTRILSLYFPTSPSPESLPELAALLLSISPRVGIRPPDMLYVDLGPTALLFGGETMAIHRVETFFREKRLRVQIAIADDLATAGALSRAKPMNVPIGGSEKALAPLSIDLLSFLVNPLAEPSAGETKEVSRLLELFSFLGLRTLGDLARLPAATLGPRFGAFGVLLQRRARGMDTPLLKPFAPTVTYRESQSFEDPIAIVEPLLFAAKNLLHRLEQKLQKDWNAPLKITLLLETEHAQEVEIDIPLTRPLAHATGWFGVIREKLSRVTLPDPVISFSIELSAPIRVRGSQFHLFDATEHQREPLEELLGRLIAGIGPTMVSAAELRERYRPEASWQPAAFEPLLAKPNERFPKLVRPTMILPSPQPLQSEQLDGMLALHSPQERFDVTTLEGPERLQGEWWGEKHARDYFVAETKQGQQLWIFKDLQKNNFFLHGYFD